MIFIGLSFIISLLFGVFTKKGIKGLLSRGGLKIKNYRHEYVINGGGIVLLLSAIAGILPLYFTLDNSDIIAYVLTLMGTSFPGFVDDCIGKTTTKGFRGHLGSIINGEMTTGIIKIIMAFFIGLILSLIYYRGFIPLLINLLQFGLCINLINLFDLRPGRAIKIFFILAFFLSIGAGLSKSFILIPIVGGITAYIKDEMDENIMMGDTGSNLLGGVLGFISIKNNTLVGSLIFTIVLILLHILSEFYSFTDIIKSSSFLMYIDNIGRMGGGDSSNDYDRT